MQLHCILLFVPPVKRNKQPQIPPDEVSFKSNLVFKLKPRSHVLEYKSFLEQVAPPVVILIHAIRGKSASLIWALSLQVLNLFALVFTLQNESIIYSATDHFSEPQPMTHLKTAKKSEYHLIPGVTETIVAKFTLARTSNAVPTGKSSPSAC